MTTIFIAEDDSQLRRFYKRALEIKGYKIIGLAKDGEDAINKFKNFSIKPDITILDHRMPIKSGIQTLKEILAFEKNLKVIIASADYKIKKEALLNGARVFLHKPFSLDILYKAVFELVNDKICSNGIECIIEDSCL